MSNGKWAAVGVAASVVGVAALGGAAMAYFMMKEEEDYRVRTMGKHVSSRPVTITVQIPEDQAGVVIGRNGSTIKEVQSRSNTRIHFKDECATEEYRYISVSGIPEDVKLAEILIHQIIANQPGSEKMVIKIPSHFCGAIIGKNGENVRALQDKSGCKIDIERRPRSDDLDRKVTLRGSLEQIDLAKSFVEEIIKEEKAFKGIQDTIPNQPLFLTSESHSSNFDSKTINKTFETETLESTSDDEMIEIYVSSISDPSYFFVQKVGPSSIALDKLGQDMTAFYEQHQDDHKVKQEEIDQGSIVVAKYSTDKNWYRARINKITIDDYDETQVDVEVDFVDFGDFETKAIEEICQIKDEFLSLKFQAIPAKLADTKPAK